MNVPTSNSSDCTNGEPFLVFGTREEAEAHLEKLKAAAVPKEVCDHCNGEGVLYPELEDGSESPYPCPHCHAAAPPSDTARPIAWRWRRLDMEPGWAKWMYQEIQPTREILGKLIDIAEVEPLYAHPEDAPEDKGEFPCGCRWWIDGLRCGNHLGHGGPLQGFEYSMRPEGSPEDAPGSLWSRALDLIEWANDLRMGSRPDVGKWGEERKAFHDAILAHPDAPRSDKASQGSTVSGGERPEQAEDAPGAMKQLRDACERWLAGTECSHPAIIGEDGFEKCVVEYCGRCAVRHVLNTPEQAEDAPEGPWINFDDLKPHPDGMTIGVTASVIGGLFAGQRGKVVDVDYGTRKARFELALNRLKGDETDG